LHFTNSLVNSVLFVKQVTWRLFKILLNNPWPCIKLIRYIMTAPNAYSHFTVYYIHSVPPTCFGHTYGHPLGGALQTIHYQNLLKLYIASKCIPFNASFCR
jgi:hypothetical protein